MDQACNPAENAFPINVEFARIKRADLLEHIALEIDQRGADIMAIASAETGLLHPRLEDDRSPTRGRLRLFAGHIRAGAYLDRRHESALPARKPAPQIEIRLKERPLGPVAVFGGSNVPLAFSTAGGDTAAALAAECPVVVKCHSAHPGTSEVVADAILAAFTVCGIPPGIVSLIQGGKA